MTANSYRKFISIMTLLHLAFIGAVMIKIDRVESKIKREVVICKVETTSYNENFVMCESGSNKK